MPKHVYQVDRKYSQIKADYKNIKKIKEKIEEMKEEYKNKHNISYKEAFLLLKETEEYSWEMNNINELKKRMKKNIQLRKEEQIHPSENLKNMLYLYVVKVVINGHVLYKIGKTNNIKTRMHNLRTAYRWDLELCFHTPYHKFNNVEPFILEQMRHKRVGVFQKNEKYCLEWFELGLKEYLHLKHLDKIGWRKLRYKNSIYNIYGKGGVKYFQ